MNYPAPHPSLFDRISTRDRILNTAERLFMLYGFDGASMRQITAEAEVNLAAVNYHFGSKEALIQEVFKRRLDQLNEERLRALDALEAAAGSKPVKPAKIVDAFFGTLLRVAKNDASGGATFLKLLGRTLTEPSEFIRAFLSHEYEHVLNRYKSALFKALPGVPKKEILWRFHFMLGATSYALAGTDGLKLVTQWTQEDDRDIEVDIDALNARLMSFLIGGLRSPLPDLNAITPKKLNRKPIKKTGLSKQAA
jgi:AcrR family transcriptional regulator